MTMKVRITNEDLQRVAIVIVEDLLPIVRSASIQSLLAGQSCDVYIHAARRVVVAEDPTATIPASPAVPEKEKA